MEAKVHAEVSRTVEEAKDANEGPGKERQTGKEPPQFTGRPCTTDGYLSSF